MGDTTAALTRPKRLRRSQLASPGICRRRRGKGWTYLDSRGRPVADRERIDDLVIPPAWREVWICPDPYGHIQATGLDEAGRRQYLYHLLWSERRSRAKFNQALDFAEALPDVRDRVAHDLRSRQMSKDRVLATAVRLLDLGFFRIGSETYAEKNGTVGLATLRAAHLTLERSKATFCYPGKHAIECIEVIRDRSVLRVLGALAKRPGAHDETLLAHQVDERWAAIRSQDVNAYIKDASGLPTASAKDFRTWSATVIAAAALAGMRESWTSDSAVRRAEAAAVRIASEHLGNTPAVCRKSYIDPRVLDRFEERITIAPDLAYSGSGQETWSTISGHSETETAVLALIREGVGAAE